MVSWKHPWNRVVVTPANGESKVVVRLTYLREVVLLRKK